MKNDKLAERFQVSVLDHILIVDDNLRDLRCAHDIARSAGFTDVEGRTTVTQTMEFLQAALLGKCPMPDVIIVDILLGAENGYEVLRICYSNPNLATIPLIVWSVMGESQREMCSLFNVRALVSKQNADGTLRAALEELQHLDSSSSTHM